MRLELIIPLFSASVAWAAARWVYFKILKIAKDKNLVDNPDARKLQKEPVPVMGGIAVFLGVVFGLLAGVSLMGMFSFRQNIEMLPILCTMVVMLYVGAMDDIIGLSPGSRFFIEAVVICGLIYASDCCVDSFHGLWGIMDFSWWIAVPLTVFAGIGIVNAVNMIDGVNGLSSVSCMIWSSFFGIFFIYSKDVANAIVAFSMVAALLPFAIHNIFGSRSRMFIGDAGTMVMGILLLWFTICLDKTDTSKFLLTDDIKINPVAMALAILGLPIFDTLRVMSVRIMHRKSPFHPDKTHLHHIFVAIGVSHVVITLTEVLIELLIVAIWVVSLLLHASLDLQLYVVVAVSIILVWGTYIFLHYHVVRHTDLLHKLTGFSVRTHIGRVDRWIRFAEWLDAPEGDKVNDVGLKKGGKNNPSYITMDISTVEYEDCKDRDRGFIIGFMKGRAEVMVFDILKNSGADRLRVYPIIFEEIRKGNVRVIKEGNLGEPLIVSLIMEQ